MRTAGVVQSTKELEMRRIIKVVATAGIAAGLVLLPVASASADYLNNPLVCAHLATPYANTPVSTTDAITASPLWTYCTQVPDA